MFQGMTTVEQLRYTSDGKDLYDKQELAEKKLWVEAVTEGDFDGTWLRIMGDKERILKVVLGKEKRLIYTKSNSGKTPEQLLGSL